MIRRMSVASAAVALLSILVACSDSTGPATVLAAVAPQGNATAVSTTTSMTMTFSGHMGQGMEQFVDLHLGAIGGAVVPMSCGWNSGETVLTCTPDSPLQPQTTYVLHMGAGMLDEAGHRCGMSRGLTAGGQWVSSPMMGGMHAGHPIGMMGSDWMDGMGHYGMMFSFTTT